MQCSLLSSALSASLWLFFQKWRRAPESHRVRQGCSLLAPRLHRARHVLGGPAGSAPALRLSQSRMLLLQYGPRLKWIPWQDWLRLCRVAPLLSMPLARHGARARMILFTRPGPICVGHRGEWKWCSRLDSHQQPPPSQSGVHLLTPREQNGAVCRCRPGALCVEDRRARCYTNTAWRVFRFQLAGFRPL
jgi:hypothetical protein